MKRKFLYMLMLLLLPASGLFRAKAAPVTTLADETLTYDVIYKWGFINKVAGYATMTLRNEGDRYQAALYARNAPWASSIYSLRDTLYSTMTNPGLMPLNYIYIAHENQKYKKDELTFQHNGDNVTATAQRFKRPAPGEPMTETTVNFEGNAPAVDMLSSFFYLRSLDFDNMANGETHVATIFSGSKPEKLTITYQGRTTVEINGQNLPAYKIVFTFTRKGSETSAPISGWISTDGQRIPLQVEGQLPVGKVRAVYTGPNP
ncbi:MAG: DUF3108 domain-containing protein [Duncaniella sp.]|nr:DUF3108 domain-containing protein [Duncaniella sp.]